MNIITALGNEELNKKLKKINIATIIGTDIQYQEALLELIEKNQEIDLLILSSILPGELNIYEFINLIKYKNSKIEIIIILEKEDNKLIEFLIAKGINNIYYNNKISIEEIIQKIYNKKNENKINELEKIIKNNNNSTKNKKNKLIKIKNKIKKNKTKENEYKNTGKIITILGEHKVGKSIFSIFLGLNLKNKKILIIDLDILKNDIKIIVGKRKYSSDKFIKWKNNITLLIISKKEFEEDKLTDSHNAKQFLDELAKQFDYIIIDIGEMERERGNN